MSRRNKPPKRVPLPDPIYGNVDVAKFINRVMRKGKKNLAQRIFYNALGILKDRTKDNELEVFFKGLKNATPLVEVKARRIGGSTYQVPIEVSEDKGKARAATWIIANAEKRSGKSMEEKLANELLDAANGVGASVKKREETHKMAEANKAFAHYRY